MIKICKSAEHLAQYLLKIGVPVVQGLGMAAPAYCAACRTASDLRVVRASCNVTVSREDTVCLFKAIDWVCATLQPLVGPFIPSEPRVVQEACTFEV